MLLSICIPTYNRGHQALKHVQEILSLDSQDIEVIVSNNGSIKGKEDYEKIKNIQDPRLNYFEFEKGQLFVQNISQVIRMSKGDFCMLLSDEDSIIEENLCHYLDLIRHSQKYTGNLFGEIWDTVGVILGGRSEFQYPDASLAAGEEAIKGAYMCGNYNSGLFFNRKIITNNLLDQLGKKFKDNFSWRSYPHMFLITEAIIKTRVIMDKTPIILEGKGGKQEGVSQQKTILEGKEFPLPLTYISWENRLKQMKGFAQHIKELDVSNDLKFLMFCALCSKTLFLLQVAKYLYLQNNIPWEKAVLALGRGMLDYLDEVDIPVVARRRKMVERHIIDLAREINGVTIVK